MDTGGTCWRLPSWWLASEGGHAHLLLAPSDSHGARNASLVSFAWFGLSPWSSHVHTRQVSWGLGFSWPSAVAAISTEASRLLLPAPQSVSHSVIAHLPRPSSALHGPQGLWDRSQAWHSGVLRPHPSHRPTSPPQLQPAHPVVLHRHCLDHSSKHSAGLGLRVFAHAVPFAWNIMCVLFSPAVLSSGFYTLHRGPSFFTSLLLHHARWAAVGGAPLGPSSPQCLPQRHAWCTGRTSLSSRL